MTLVATECLEWLRSQDDNSVDLVFTSPPYEAARTYGIGFKLKGQEWVDWAVERYAECVRVSRGLVAWVVNGQQRNYRWSASPALLMADLHRRGIHLKKPPAFHRIGIPGSGQKDWLRDDYEFIICATSGGKLPWSDNTALGEPPKWAPGGAMSHRLTNGERKNVWGQSPGSSVGARRTDGTRQVKTPKASFTTPSEHARKNGAKGSPGYDPPVLSNPGNVIKCKVGGGHMGSKWAHDNEAPFPESLAEFFIRSFCPSGGVVLDPFVGSGTTCAVAVKHDRKYIGLDVRPSQIAIATRRICETMQSMKGSDDA